MKRQDVNQVRRNFYLSYVRRNGGEEEEAEGNYGQKMNWRKNF